MRTRLFLGTGRRTCAAVAIRGALDEELYGSGGGPVVVVQHAAQALPSLNLPGVAEVARFWTDEPVPQSLMIPFVVIMGDEILNGCTNKLVDGPAG